MMPGEKSEPPAPGAEFVGAEAAGGADGSADPNYMYSTHAAHNGAGAGEGY